MFDPYDPIPQIQDVVLECFNGDGTLEERRQRAEDARDAYYKQAVRDREMMAKDMRELISLLWEANGMALFGSMSSYDIDGPNPRATFSHLVTRYGRRTPEKSWKALWADLDKRCDGETAWAGLVDKPEEAYDDTTEEWVKC